MQWRSSAGRSVFRLMLVVGLCSGGVGAASAQERSDAVWSRVQERIAAVLGLTAQQVQSYQQQLGLGSLIFAARLADQSGQSLDTIVERRSAGEGWGEIAHSLGLSASRRNANLGQIMRQPNPGQSAKPTDKPCADAQSTSPDCADPDDDSDDMHAGPPPWAGKPANPGHGNGRGHGNGKNKDK